MPYIFEWDPEKAAANLTKHGVPFAEATEAFGDPLSVNMPDPSHSSAEERFLVLGLSRSGRLLVVSYAERPANPNHQCTFSQPLRAAPL